MPVQPKPSLLTVAYLRRSTPKQADSIERQRELVQEYAARHGLTIDRELRDTKPGDEIDRREGLQELLQLVKARQVGTLLIDEWSRLGRGDPDEVAAYILLPLKKGKVKLHTAKDGPRDLHGLAGRVLNTLSASQASDEVINLSRRVVAGRALLAKQGRRLGGKDTYGYVVVRETVHVPGRGPRLVPVGMVPDPDRAYWVRYIFRRYAEDPVTIEGLARELDRLGAPAPRGGLWSESGIRCMLDNPVYLGTLAYGRRRNAKYYTLGQNGVDAVELDPDDKGKDRARPESEWLVVLGHHEALIDEVTWNRVQARLRTNRNIGRVGARGASLFAGRVFCKACGRPMAATMLRGERLYRCRPTDRKTGKTVCSWRAVRESELLKTFCDSLSRLATDDELLDASVAHLRQRLENNRAAAGTRRLDARRAELQGRIERAKDNLTVLPKERIPDQLKRLDALERELATLSDPEEATSDVVPRDWAAKVRELLQSADQFSSWLRTLPTHRQRDVVQEAVMRCEVEFQREGRHLVPRDGVFLLDPACLGVDTDALCRASHGVSSSG